VTPAIVDAELLADVRADLGEGPAWDAERAALSYVDITAGAVHVCTADGAPVRTYSIGRTVGAALPAAGGGFLLADEVGFTVLADDGESEMVLPVLADAPGLQFNDGKCDPAGRAWAGSLAKDGSEAAGTLYRLDDGPVATPVFSRLTVSNGLDWSPDTRTMWFVDSGKPVVTGYEYDLDSGGAGPVRSLIELEQPDGVVPDGLCVDNDGCVWVALWGGRAVLRYAPDGRLDTIVRVPTRHVTSCTFGGSRMSTLYITTARGSLTPEALRAEPHAGALFALETGVTGRAATPWRRDERATTTPRRGTRG
jgi:sugar lactone lactonase YvrE